MPKFGQSQTASVSVTSMPEVTKIQWCDSTVNPIMGCGGCELFIGPGELLPSINQAVAAKGAKVDSRKIFKILVDECFSSIADPGPFKKAVNTTNMWHLRERFADKVERDHGKAAGEAAMDAICKAVTCYAASLHLNKGLSIVNPTRSSHKGHAPTFESVTRFAGRAAAVAKYMDLLGQSNPKSPWKERLPRMVFVSDMGDALSAKGDFPFLKADLMPAIQSQAGMRHLWLWLTKQPGRMAEFANDIGGFPPNVCAMTTVTSMKTLGRIDQLRQVKADIRGLSIEPLWERIPPNKLNLKGIDWLILGGESGSGKLTRPFALEWTEELREHCQRQGVAYFLKQLGRNPSRGGTVFKLKDKHGGDWSEWDESLRTREFPAAFHQYRANDMKPSEELRPIVKKKKPKDPDAELVSPEDKADFKRLDKVVRKGVAAFIESGKALLEIHERKLWKAGEHRTWEAYCREVAGFSKSYAQRIMEASQIAVGLSYSLPIGNDFISIVPLSEFQIRPLHQLDDLERQQQVWAAAVEKAQGQPTANQIREVVFEILAPESSQENRPTRSQQRMDLVGRLKMVIQKRKSWEDVDKLLLELEGLL